MFGRWCWRTNSESRRLMGEKIKNNTSLKKDRGVIELRVSPCRNNTIQWKVPTVRVNIALHSRVTVIVYLYYNSGWRERIPPIIISKHRACNRRGILACRWRTRSRLGTRNSRRPSASSGQSPSWTWSCPPQRCTREAKRHHCNINII